MPDISGPALNAGYRHCKEADVERISRFLRPFRLVPERPPVKKSKMELASAAGFSLPNR
jgi:hypothetical protein